MTPGLFVLSRDVSFVEQMRARFSGRFDLLVADSMNTALARLKAVPVRAVLAHLSYKTLNGHPAGSFVKELQALGSTAPIYMLSSVGDNLNLSTDYSELGLAGVLQKPLDNNTLLTILKTKLK